MPGMQCWKVMKCSQEGECPAYPERGFECWNVEGTLCRGERQQGYSQKIGDCRTKCEYYNKVMNGTVSVT
jgi:methyl-accepting chemotaxis protein